MLTKLNKVISESGIWDGNRKENHSFFLSPSLYQISDAKYQELLKLGFALYDCLLGLSHIATIAYDQNLNYGGVWAFIRKIFSTGVPKIYQELQAIKVRDIPKLLKVDLMVDQDGNFKIAEIDGHNKHGLGYSTLAKRFREVLKEEKSVFPGVVKSLAGEIKNAGYSELKLFYADQERFYLPEFEIAGNEFAKHGIDCKIVSETNADEEFLSSGLFLDLPFLYDRVGLYETIISAYKNGDVKFIIPPKPFLGAKSVLAFLRNDNKDEKIEAILRTFIFKDDSLNLVRRYIPETFFVGKQSESFESITTRILEKDYVLKESISSGMKGTIFSDQPDFKKVLQVACNSKTNWILQEEVKNNPQTFSWFNGNGNTPELKTSEDWFMRVTTHYVNRQLADIIVTARRDKAVHGAKDSIQIGAIVL